MIDTEACLRMARETARHRVEREFPHGGHPFKALRFSELVVKEYMDRTLPGGYSQAIDYQANPETKHEGT